MRVLFVTNDTMLLGGTASSFLTILDNLPKMVEQVYVLMPGRGNLTKIFVERKISVWVMDYKPAWTQNHYITMEDILKERDNIKCARKLAERIKENHIDIVYTNSGIIDVGAMAARFARVRHIWHRREFVHEHFKRKYVFEWKEGWLLRHADPVVVISKCMLKELRKRYHITNSIVLYNKFDIKKYYNERDDLFTNDTIKCLVTGRMYEGKGQLTAVEAIGRVIELQHMPIELYLVGGGEAEYTGKITNRMKALGIQEQVHILKYENDMKALRQKMDIEISCSQWEAFGRNVIEGMLSGLFIIGANSGATPELINYKRNGLLYRNGDAEDLAQKIVWICNHREEARHIAHEGQKWASQLYSDDTLNRDLEMILSNVNRRVKG